jgi:DNA-directed RNA polymerase specialized sigma subunit
MEITREEKMRTENIPSKHMQIMNCSNCNKRPTCRSICSAIEDQLPSIEKGRVEGRQVRRSVLAPSLTRFEEAKLVLKFRCTFSRRQRQIVEAFYEKGMTMPEIAKRLKISYGAAAQYRCRALLRVAKVLKTIRQDNQELI